MSVPKYPEHQAQRPDAPTRAHGPGREPDEGHRDAEDDPDRRQVGQRCSRQPWHLAGVVEHHAAALNPRPAPPITSAAVLPAKATPMWLPNHRRHASSGLARIARRGPSVSSERAARASGPRQPAGNSAESRSDVARNESTRLAPARIEVLRERVVVGDEVVDRRRQRPAGERQREHADGPPQHVAALQPHGQPERLPSEGAARGGARPGREQARRRSRAGSQSATATARHQRRRCAREEQQRPPLLAAVGPGLLRPADRRQPRQRSRRRRRRRPAARTTAPRTAPASPHATRGFSVTCAVTAVRPTNSNPKRDERRAEARSNPRPAGRSAMSDAARQRADDDVQRRRRRPARRPAARGGRPACDADELEPAALLLATREPADHAARSSSPTMVRPNAPIWNATWPPIGVEGERRPVEREGGRVVLLDARAAWSSDAWVGYRPFVLAAVDEDEQHDGRDPDQRSARGRAGRCGRAAPWCRGAGSPPRRRSMVSRDRVRGSSSP